MPAAKPPGWELHGTFKELRVTGVEAQSRGFRLAGREGLYCEFRAKIDVVRNWAFYPKLRSSEPFFGFLGG